VEERHQLWLKKIQPKKRDRLPLLAEYLHYSVPNRLISAVLRPQRRLIMFGMPPAFLLLSLEVYHRRWSDLVRQQQVGKLGECFACRSGGRAQYRGVEAIAPANRLSAGTPLSEV